MKDLHNGRDKEADLREASRLRKYAATLRQDARKMEDEADRLEGMHPDKNPWMLKTERKIERASQGAVMTSTRPDASGTDTYVDFSDDAPIPPHTTRPHTRSLTKPPHEPATPGVFQRKIYCSHWLRTGECDFTQQGCEFLHVMPDPDTLKQLQYRTYPRWYCEQMKISAADAAALLGDSVSVPTSSSASSAPRVPAKPYRKTYCSHWLRTGECDFLQQGCIYQHLMPELETLHTLGFRTYPRWWREKGAMEEGGGAALGARGLRQFSATTEYSQDQGAYSTRPLVDVEMGDVIFGEANLEDAKTQRW